MIRETQSKQWLRYLFSFLLILFIMGTASAQSVYYPAKGNGDGTLTTPSLAWCTSQGLGACKLYNEGSLAVGMDANSVKYAVQNNLGEWRYIKYDIPNPNNIIPTIDAPSKSLIWTNIYANSTSLAYRMQNHGIKMDIYGSGTPPSNTFNFTYSLSSGINPQKRCSETESCEIDFFDSYTGELLWTVNYPIMQINKTDVPLTFKRIGDKISIHALDLFTNPDYNFSAGWELDPSTQSGSTIYISDRHNLTEVNADIANVSAMQNLGSGEWLLNANLVNNNTANTFYLNSSDVTWLKINSTTPEGIPSVTNTTFWYYLTSGKTEIADTKITSWNVTTSAVELLPVATYPRSSVYASGASSKMNISNSNLSYLGYNAANMYGVYYTTNTGGNVISNSTFLKNYRGIHFYTSNSNNVSGTFSGDLSYGIYLQSSSSNTIDAISSSNTNYGIRLESSSSNNITGSFSSGTSSDYQLTTSYNNNKFNNTNFTVSRKITLNDNTSIFEYDNGTGVWLKTQIVASPTTTATTTRNIMNWNQSNVSWSETFTASKQIRYNFSGLMPSTNYQIYNGSSIDYNLTTDESGVLTPFTINFSTTINIIKVLSLESNPPTYSSVGHDQTMSGLTTLFSIQYNDTTALEPNGQYTFCTNNTGVWECDSPVSFTSTPQWSNVSKQIVASADTVLGYYWNATDNAGNSNNTPIYTFTVTQQLISSQTTLVANSSGNSGQTGRLTGENLYSNTVLNSQWTTRTTLTSANLNAMSVDDITYFAQGGTVALDAITNVNFTLNGVQNINWVNITYIGTSTTNPEHNIIGLYNSSTPGWTKVNSQNPAVGTYSTVSYNITSQADKDKYLILSGSTLTFRFAVWNNGTGNAGLSSDLFRAVVDYTTSVPPVPRNLSATIGDNWVNNTWDKGYGGSVNDTFNVSHNGTWFNETTNMFLNATVGSPHGYSDICVWEFNVVLSAASVCQNTTSNSPISITNVSASYTVNESETLYIDANYDDSDNDIGVFSSNSTDWEINTSTGVVSWATGYTDAGVYNWYIDVEDNSSSSMEEFTVTVNDVDTGYVYASSCNKTDVEYAIDNATSGKIVSIPNGTCAWDTWITTLKTNITIMGQGIGNTIIQNYGFKVSNGVDDWRITGIEFSDPDHSCCGTDDLNSAVTFGNGEVDHANWNFRIDHNKFDGYYRWITGDGHSYGVIDHNDFYDSQSTGIRMLGQDNYSWEEESNLGSYDFLFFEDNNFYKTANSAGMASQHAMMAQDGVRYVFRYNTFTEPGISGGSNEYYWPDAIDVHGCCNYASFDVNGTPTNGNEGGRVTEIYSNIYYRNTTNTCCDFIQYRGGTGTIFNNSVIYASGSPSMSSGEIQFWESRATHDVDAKVNANCWLRGDCPVWAQWCDPANPGTPNQTGAGEGYPCCGQVGRGKSNGTGQELEPVYLWGNENSTDGITWKVATTTVSSAYYGADAIQENRDYYNISEGTTLPSTCNVNQGYFKNDTNILYKCTATNVWTEYYTPYTYPHPLTTEEGYVAPVITNVVNGTVTDTTAIINFTIDQADATTQVKYSTDESLSLNTTNTTAGGYDRTETLTSLDHSTKYYYSVFAYNSANTSLYTNSTIQNFTTTAGDTTPPASITSVSCTGNATGFYVNCSWTNPIDADYDHLWLRYSNGTSYTSNITTPTAVSNISWYAHANQNLSGQTVDTTGNINTTLVWLNATVPNNNITITNTSNFSGTEGNTIYVDYNVVDADSDIPIFSCNRTDLFTDFSTSTGIGNWVTNATSNGIYYVDFGVSDANGSTSNYTMTITLNATAPNITAWHNSINGWNQTAMSVNAGNTVTFNVTADQAVDNVSWIVAGSEEQNTSSLEFNRTFNTIGEFNVTAQALNANGNSNIIYTVVTVTSTGGGGTDWDWLDGYVKNEYGIPINLAWVNTSEGNTQTGVTGYYSFGYVFADGDSYWINASKSGYYPNNTYLLFNEDHEVLNITLTSIAEITAWNVSGYVYNSTGSFIEGSLVSYSGGSNTTDANGYWIISNVSNGTYDFTASKSGYASNVTSITMAGAELTNQNFTLNEITQVNVTGYIFNQLAAPLYMARVDTNNTYAFTDINGAYTLTGLDTYTEYEFLARAIGYENNTNTTTLYGDTLVNFTMLEFRPPDYTELIEGILGIVVVLLALIAVGIKRKKKKEKKNDRADINNRENDNNSWQSR